MICGSKAGTKTGYRLGGEWTLPSVLLLSAAYLVQSLTLFPLFQQSAARDHFWPTEGTKRVHFTIRSPPVSAGPAHVRHGVRGLFTEMCYPHQTGVVKSQHVVLLFKHSREREADSACISFSLSSYSSHLPGTAHSILTRLLLSFFLARCRSSIWVIAAASVVSPWEFVNHLSNICWKSGSLSACRVTTHENQKVDHADQMLPLRLFPWSFHTARTDA